MHEVKGGKHPWPDASLRVTGTEDIGLWGLQDAGPLGCPLPLLANWGLSESHSQSCCPGSVTATHPSVLPKAAISFLY